MKTKLNSVFCGLENQTYWASFTGLSPAVKSWLELLIDVVCSQWVMIDLFLKT